jgi:hypothetical protein
VEGRMERRGISRASTSARRVEEHERSRLTRGQERLENHFIIDWYFQSRHFHSLSAWQQLAQSDPLARALRLRYAEIRVV